MNIEDFKKQYEIGYPILKQLCEGTDANIKEKLRSILDSKYHEILDDKPCVTRIMKNEEWSELHVSVWGSIEVSPYGIYYKPEHGGATKLIDFNKHFVL